MILICKKFLQSKVKISNLSVKNKANETCFQLMKGKKNTEIINIDHIKIGK